MSKNNIIEAKVITLGESGVGKSSIIKRFIYNKFEDNALSTIGIDFSFKEIILENNATIKLKIMDTSGQEKFRALSKSYYKNADGVFFVFALNNMDSFEDLKNWIDEFKNNNSLSSVIPKYLVGNKSDLSNTNITETSIKQFKEEYNMDYYEISAKTNKNIDKLFQDMGEILYDNYKNSGAIKGIQLKNKNINEKKKKACCDQTISVDV